VGEDLADGDFVAAGEAGDVLADRVVEGELAFCLEEQDGGGGELLGDGAEWSNASEAWRGRRVSWGGEAGAAVGVGVDELAALTMATEAEGAPVWSRTCWAMRSMRDWRAGSREAMDWAIAGAVARQRRKSADRIGELRIFRLCFIGEYLLRGVADW